MVNDKKDDNASAPTRIREVKPAGKPMAPREEQLKPMQQEIGGGSSAPTMIRGYGGASAGGGMNHQAMSDKDAGGFDPVVGWLVIVEGPGRGKVVNIYAGMNSLGRSAGQRIRVDFGDATISGEGAAFITFEPKRRTFHINHGGKANIVYLNDEAVLTPMPLTDGNAIAIGESKFRFVQLCGPDFTWDDMK
jgi:hypothetical protein